MIGKRTNWAEGEQQGGEPHTREIPRVPYRPNSPQGECFQGRISFGATPVRACPQDAIGQETKYLFAIHYMLRLMPGKSVILPFF